MTEYPERLRALLEGSHLIDRTTQAREVCSEFQVSPQQLEQDLAAVRSSLEPLATALYCCGGRACCRNARALPEIPGVPVIRTACLGPCKQGPVLKLKQHGDEQYFGRVDSAAKVEALVDFCLRARRQQSLMVDAREAHSLRFDPHHPHPPDPELNKLGFLCGKFRGSGRILADGQTFTKESEGRWEAGGRFLSLRQRAVYGDDIHTAVVIIGTDGATAFRDDGSRLSYEPKWFGGKLVFDDMVPHRAQARFARKVIRATEGGYRETLEVSRDGTQYRPYYEIDHLKVRRKSEAHHARL